MRELTAAELLKVYEFGLSKTPLETAIGVLAAACPERPPEEIARLSAGRRDELLLRLRELTFGPRLDCVADCPACGAELEFAFQVSEIRIEGSASRGPLEIDGFEIDVRPPDTTDLIAASRAAGLEEARATLLDRCVSARRSGVTLVPSSLPAAVIAAISEEMARCDPQADVRLSVACASCGHGWDAAFDIAAFLWKEIQRAALRSLREVHALASAYGWSEAAILEMSPWRRQAYLRMAAE